jgi:hypothetical protein
LTTWIAWITGEPAVCDAWMPCQQLFSVVLTSVHDGDDAGLHEGRRTAIVLATVRGRDCTGLHAGSRTVVFNAHGSGLSTDSGTRAISCLCRKILHNEVHVSVCVRERDITMIFSMGNHRQAWVLNLYLDGLDVWRLVDGFCLWELYA